MIIFKILPLLFLTMSCQKNYDIAACNDLSMKKFKGFTDARKKFADNCTQFKIKYTQEVCQDALNDLILNNDLQAVKIKYGEAVEGCFNEPDLKKYNKT